MLTLYLPGVHEGTSVLQQPEVLGRYTLVRFMGSGEQVLQSTINA